MIEPRDDEHIARLVRFACLSIAGGTRNATAMVSPATEAPMDTETRSIDWQRDVDAAIQDAQRTQRPLLLDFTAAPQ